MNPDPDLFALDAQGRLWLGFYPREPPYSLFSRDNPKVLWPRIRWRPASRLEVKDMPSYALQRVRRADGQRLRGVIIPTDPTHRAPQFEYLDDL